MEKSLLALKASITAAVAAITAVFGWMGWLVLFWIGLMLGDWITGSLASARNGNWNSARARSGIWHKGGMIVIVGVAAGADFLIGIVVNHIPGIGLPFAYSVALCPLALVWYCVTEMGSITENAGAMGAPIPGFLTKALKLLNATFEKKADESTSEPDNEEKLEA